MRYTLQDPVQRVRLFSEHWSRVSSKGISKPERVEARKLKLCGVDQVVRLPGSHGCGNISRRLPLLPAGLLHMREQLGRFGGYSEMSKASA